MLFSGAFVLGMTFAALAAQQGSLDGDGNYVISVANGNATLSSEDVAALGSSVPLVKRGAGRLVIETNLRTAGYAGEIRVEEGYLRARALGALGTTAGGTVVSNGATLEIDGSSVGANVSNFVNGEPLTLSGDGVLENGEPQGVIRNVGGNDQYPGSGNWTMLTDCSVGASSLNRFDCRSATFDMNGHTLTILSKGYYAFTSCTVKNPGNIVTRTGGRFTIESSSTFNGDASNSVSLEGTSSFVMQNASKPIPWTLNVSGTPTFETWSGGMDTNHNVWAGPIVLASDSVFTLNPRAAYWVTFAGKITGAGALKVTGGPIWLTNDENDFTGGVLVNSANGILHVTSPGALPGIDVAARNVANYGVINAMCDGGAWSDNDLMQLFANTKSQNGGAAVAYLASGAEKTFTVAGTEAIGIGHGGTNSVLHVVGDISNPDATFVNLSGTMTYEGAAKVAQFTVSGGLFSITNGGSIYVTNTTYVAGVWPNVARLLVADGTLCETNVYMSNPSAPLMTVGRTSTNAGNARGILEVCDGGIVTARVNYASGSTTMGALYLRDGGYYYNLSNGGGNDNNVGSGGPGYVEIEAGSAMDVCGYWHIGGSYGSRGVFHQKGGTLKMAAQAFMVGTTGGYGAAHFSGGTATINGRILLNKSEWSEGPNNKDGRASLSVGGDAFVYARDGTWLSVASNAVSTLNLVRGTLASKFITRSIHTQEARPAAAYYAFGNNPAYVNFNGGAFRTLANGVGISNRISRVTVFPAGAIFDTSNYVVTTEVPFRAPTGKGIASIPLPPVFTVPWNALGAPYIDIQGDGYGACAVAEYDSTNGVVTGVRITSPGCDYTTATATFSRAGWTNTVTVACTLADNLATGGFAKRGTGTLTLGADVETTGAIGVEAGVLNLAGHHPGAAAGLFGGGVLNGDVSIAGTWTIEASELVKRRTLTVNGAVTIADGTTIHVNDPDNLLSDEANLRVYPIFTATSIAGGATVVVDNLDPPWRAGASGTTFSLGYRNGTLVIFR